MKVQAINQLGGMALVESNVDFYSCPEWIDEKKWNQYRERYRKASLGSPDLIQIDLELTDACNLKCIECPISSEKKRTINRLNIPKAKEILSYFASKGALALKLNYINEPLLNFDELLEVAAYAKKVGFIDIYFTSNGTLLDGQRSKKIIDSNLFSRIQISIDAKDSETYDKIRIGGDYKKVIENISNFMKERDKSNSNFPYLRVNFLSLPENKNQEHDFHSFWSKRVDAVAIQRSVLKPDSKRENSSTDFVLKKRFCPNPFRQLVIRADLTVLPCCSFWGCNIPLGKYNDNAKRNYFDSDFIKTIRASFLDSKKELHSACSSCLSSCDPTY